MKDSKRCPRCDAALLWNGRGMSCIACPYFSAEAKPPSEKALVVPRKKKPGEESK